MMKILISCTLLVVCLVYVSAIVVDSTGQSYIVFGTTVSVCGDPNIATFSNFTSALILGLNTINAKGGVTINNTNYLYKYVQYPDGLNDLIVKATYAYLRDHLNVDFFLGPYYTLSPGASVQAEALKILVLLTEYPADTTFNNAPSNYTLSISPTLTAFCSTCLIAVQKALALNGESSSATIFLAYTEDTYNSAQETKNVIQQYGMTLVGDIFYNSSVVYSQLAASIRAQKPRIIMGGGVGDLPQFLQAIRKEIGLAKDWSDPVIVTFDPPFPNNNWFEEGVLAPQPWTFNLPNTQQDEYFGTAQDFSYNFNATAGRYPYYGEASAVASVLAIHKLLNVTQSLDGAVLAAYAKTGVNVTSSFFGEISFNGVSLARSYICTQNNAQIYPIVDPPELATSTVNLYPVIDYPKGFFSNNGTDNTLRDALIGSLVTTFGIMLIGLLIVVIVVKKYHLIFIPKREKF